MPRNGRLAFRPHASIRHSALVIQHSHVPAILAKRPIRLRIRPRNPENANPGLGILWQNGDSAASMASGPRVRQTPCQVWHSLGSERAWASTPQCLPCPNHPSAIALRQRDWALGCCLRKQCQQRVPTAPLSGWHLASLGGRGRHPRCLRCHNHLFILALRQLLRTRVVPSLSRHAAWKHKYRSISHFRRGMPLRAPGAAEPRCRPPFRTSANQGRVLPERAHRG